MHREVRGAMAPGWFTSALSLFAAMARRICARVAAKAIAAAMLLMLSARVPRPPPRPATSYARVVLPPPSFAHAIHAMLRSMPPCHACLRVVKRAPLSGGVAQMW